MMFVSTTKAMAMPQPVSLLLAKSRVDRCFPPGSNVSDGEKSMHNPVKFSSNSSMETSMVPFAGSFKDTFPFLNPFTTTK